MKKQYTNFKKFWVPPLPNRVRDKFWRGVRGEVVVLLLLLTSFTPDNTCLNNVKKVFDEMKTLSENSTVSYLKYTVIATLHEKNKADKNIVNTSTFELITQKENGRIYSKEMIVLRDKKNTFTILPQKKTIYWTNTYTKEKPEDAYNNLRKMQDSIFKHAEKVDCKAVTGQPYNKRIEIVLDKKTAAYMQMEKLTYCIEDEKNLLNKVEIDYLPGNEFENIVYVFSEQNYDYKKEKMNTPVYDLVFESGNTLQKKYAGFKLMDTRKK